MSNPNNLIRPPVLNPENPQSNPPNPAPMNAAIQQQIASFVAEQVRATLQYLHGPKEEIANDIVIEEENRNNLSELDKIPDIVRSIREFSGNPAEFNSWKKSVDRVLEIYDSIRGSAKYFGILSVIRNKIIGNADAALESYSTPLNWKSIVKCLTLHYGDKRDLGTLEYQMTSLIQGRNTIQVFYQEVYTQLSLILNKIGCMDISRESATLLTQTYRDKALDTFIRGLNGDLPKLLGIREPSDLPQALHLCLKLENQNYRSEYANNHQTARPRRELPPPLPKRPLNLNRLPFYPELTFQQPNPQRKLNLLQFQNNNRPHQQPFFNQNQQPPRHQHFHQSQVPIFQPPRPIAPKPIRPEPMDVDTSIQTKNVNYLNRPSQTKQFYGKRPIPQSVNTPMPHNKFQRNFHIDTNQEIPSNNYVYDQHGSNYEQEIQSDSFQNYIQDYFEQEHEQDNSHTEDLSDIHFLG